MRDYVTKRVRSSDDWDANGSDSLARTVYEEHELIDIGVMDKDGNPIMARKRMDPVGFVRFPASKP